jgi:hypothetical protein
MSHTLRHYFTLVIAAVVAVTLAASAHAQQPRPGGRRPVVVPPLPTYNPNYYLPNGLSINQYAYNLSTIGRAYSHVPPYLFGYNPYPPTIVNTYPAYPYSPLYQTPYLVNPSYPLMGTFTNPYFYTNPYFSLFRTYP